MDLRLEGKRAIVTGASKGIGLAVARVLAAEGARVALVARTRPTLEAAAAGIGRAFVADTTDDAAVRAMVDAVVADLGGVDILVNSAARPSSSGRPAGLVDLTDDMVRVEFETKVLGYLRAARAVAPHMIANGWGRIVNISGLNARQSGTIVGSMRNVSVAAMTKNLADELGPHGINVTVVHPGRTTTERTPGLHQALADEAGTTPDAIAQRFADAVAIGRLPTGEEVADVVAFLCSPRSVAITGDAVVAGGGIKGSIYY